MPEAARHEGAFGSLCQRRQPMNGRRELISGFAKRHIYRHSLTTISNGCTPLRRATHVGQKMTFLMKQPALRRNSKVQCHSAGFTLIEVLITIAIVAILASIAYPSYTDYLRRGQAQEAPGVLSDFRARMEQYYQDNRNYGAGATCGVAAPTLKNFGWTCANAGQSYLATATGNTGSLVRGLAYTVDQSNSQQTTCNGCAWNFSGSQSYWVLRKQ